MYHIFETGRDEENLFFSTATEEQACVGHLRGDFGSGTEFWTTWWDHHEELKDQPFRDELDAVVNALRKDGPLKDLRSMEDFCRKRPRSRMSPASGSDYYGFRVDTGRHRFYLRFLPRRGDYTFYIYCYQTDRLIKDRPQPAPSSPKKKKTKTQER